MDGALNGVAVVVDQEDDGVKTLTHHGSEFLDGQLRRAVTDKEHTARIAISHRSTQKSRQSVADEAP